MKWDCPKIKNEGKGKEGPSFKAKVWATKIEEENEEDSKEETPSAYDFKTLMAHIRKMKTEERDEFLDQLLVQDHQGFWEILRLQPTLGLLKLTP